MNIITNIDAKKFSLNGIQYFKNYISNVAGNNLRIINAYDSCDVLLDWLDYSQISVNGVVYGSVALLQQNLIDACFNRAIGETSKNRQLILFGGTFEFIYENSYLRYPNAPGTLNWSLNNYIDYVTNILIPSANDPILHYFDKASKITRLSGTARPLAQSNFTIALVKHNLILSATPFINSEIIFEEVVIPNTNLNQIQIVDIPLNISIEAGKVICVYIKSSVTTQLNRARFNFEIEN